ncbi:CNVH-domain-containing protein [Daldinia bambusicola]|nr:CNVH-domain-containing protein [Daldinia bambusicola]
MAFSLTSKNIELRGSWLVAEVRRPEDGSWTFSRLNLNEHIGNNDGVFDVTMDRWHNTAQQWSVRLRGPILYARLRTIAGGYAEETCINLDLFVRNRDGNLEFQKLGDSLLLYTAGLTLDNAILRGLAVGRDGKFHLSEIDLDEYFGNIGSKFEIDERHYSRTGRNFRLERESNRLRLFGELQDYEGVHHPAEVDLSACIVNRKGRLSFSKPADPVEREHWTTVVAEQIPVFGPAIAGLHRSKDETRTENQSYYEIATSTNSASFTVGLAIGAFIGRACESPIIGTVLGAALSNASDIFVEDQVVNAIEDPHARSQVQEAKLGSFVSEALRILIIPEHIAAAAEFLSASFNPEIDVWKNGLAAWLEKQNLNNLADLSLYATMKKVFKELQGETIEEWQNTLAEIESLKQRSQILQLKPEDPPQVIVEEPEGPETEAIEAPETAVETEAEAEASNDAEAPQPDTVSELEAADKVPEINGTEATTQTEPVTEGTPTEATATEPGKAAPEAANTASSSTRASSENKSVLKDGAKNTSQTNVPSNGNGKPSANPKRWHSVIGIPVWRKSWSRPRQQRVV